MKNIRAIKRLGQNYLIDPNIIRKFVDAAKIEESDTVIEIGPGKGAITSELLNKTRNIIAVDIDSRVIEPLKEMLPDVKILNRDILDINFNEFEFDKKLKFIGNIPFNLTSPILFKLVESKEYISDATFIVQDEVAGRITAKRGTKDYGILSVILNYVADTEICFKISKNVFKPQPKVNTAVLQVKFKNVDDSGISTDKFIKVVKASFGQRRKTLKNSLSNSIFGTYDLSEVTLDLRRRAEELSINDFVNLTKQLKRKAYD